MKIVLVLIAVAVLWWLLFGRSRVAKAKAKASRAAPRATAPQPMLACAFCGVHLPQSDALLVGDAAFCGAEHRLAFERDGPRP